MKFSRSATYFAVCFLFSVALIGLGCQEKKPAAGAPILQVFEDDLGRPVKLKGRVSRAVSLAPSLTEMIFAVGAGDRLVGVTAYCNYPAEAKSIASVGDTQTPNIERIVVLKPDVVFVSTASQLEAFASTLQQQGIEIFVTNPTDLRGVMQNIRTFGSIFGREKESDEIAAALDQRTLAVDARVRGREKWKVFVQISKEPLFTIGNDSFLTEIVARAGAVSVTRDIDTAYPKLSKETALAMSPDVIILSDSEDNREPNSVFNDSPAVKNGRVYRINADIISRPGPRLVDALEEIAAVLHPEN